MKKTLIVAASLIFISSVFSACRSSEPHCQAYSKAVIKTDRTVTPL